MNIKSRKKNIRLIFHRSTLEGLVCRQSDWSQHNLFSMEQLAKKKIAQKNIRFQNWFSAVFLVQWQTWTHSKKMLSKWTSHDGIHCPRKSGIKWYIHGQRLLIVSTNIGRSMGYINILPMWLLLTLRCREKRPIILMNHQCRCEGGT